MAKRMYFAHPVNTYNTPLEKKLLGHIEERFQDYKIENPNQKKHQLGYKRYREQLGNGMLYFTEDVLPECDACIFLAFRDGKLGAGVAKEIDYFLQNNLPVWEISANGRVLWKILNIPKDKVLSVEETRARIRNAEGETLSY